MKVFGLWHGGPSYRPGEYRDIEEFDTVAQARRAFESRSQNRDGSTPCVEDSEMWLWRKHKPYDNGVLYADTVLKFGPRGAVREERA